MHLAHQFQVPEIMSRSDAAGMWQQFSLKKINVMIFIKYGLYSMHKALQNVFIKQLNQHYLRNFDKLIMVVMAIKEWLLPKYLHQE
jgi:hypothetical protein